MKSKHIIISPTEVFALVGDETYEILEETSKLVKSIINQKDKSIKVNSKNLELAKKIDCMIKYRDRLYDLWWALEDLIEIPNLPYEILTTEPEKLRSKIKSIKEAVQE